MSCGSENQDLMGMALSVLQGEEQVGGGGGYEHLNM